MPKTNGYIAVHWKDAFIKNMKSLKLEPTEESGLLIFQLSHKYVKAEIKKLYAIEEYLSFIGLTLHPKKRILK